MRGRGAGALGRLSAVDPLVLDGALALVMSVGSVLWAVYEPGRATRPVDGLSAALTAVVNLPLALRRRMPFTVLVVSVAGAVVYHALGYHYGLNSMAPLLALYTVAAHRPAAATVAGTVLVVAEWIHAVDLHPGIQWWSAVGQSVLVAGVTVCIGSGVRLLDERTGRLTELAARLREEQAAAALRAVTQERVRIARELHDVVAHHMSVISVQAGMGRYVALGDPAAARETLGVIADASHEALGEMRRLLSILRVEAYDEDEDLYAITPGLGGLTPLLERVRAAGPAVEVRVVGEARPLPSGLDLCAYRIVQESLTNVLKHAGAARVEVLLEYGAAELTVSVTDDGTAAPGAPGSGGAGHGLIGMTERVRLYQGKITAGSRPEGGFAVVAVLPLPAPAPGG
ncbi:sensor histidine kinase [Planomonospora sp. ID91781]|uniref:sensor histidine kinase n=1 Tax=Planomonospora sp. ID91781 TaxID=2738135 RepID=UPI0018C43B90|nr:histidine kinase [Planomonospora sp. ID91781]MBG0824593.1 sensor histidine kinase [Planomonospora sp. ID91781]